MDVTSTINCECGCLFETSFQDSTEEVVPKCPMCKKEMDLRSWQALRNTMGALADYNYHVLKWGSEHEEPKMMVPALTVRTL